MPPVSPALPSSSGSAIASHLKDPRNRFSYEGLRELAVLLEAKRNPSPEQAGDGD